MVTADHGHIQATGTGRLQGKGELAEIWSKRVVLFQAPATCKQFRHRGQPFRPLTAPPGQWPLFARGHESFDRRDAQGHSHGGWSLEELLVPVAELLP